jgi:hypothetical protein
MALEARGSHASGEFAAGLDRGCQPADLDPLVVGDRRHRKDHSGPQRRGNQFQRAEACTGLVDVCPLIDLKTTIPGCDAGPFPTYVDRLHPIQQGCLTHLPSRLPASAIRGLFCQPL